MFPSRDSLAYIQIFVPHLECEILKTISEESVGWTKVIFIDNLVERAIGFCNCILFLKSNHGCLFTPTMILFRKFSILFDVKFSIVYTTLSFFDFSSYFGVKKKFPDTNLLLSFFSKNSIYIDNYWRNFPF